MRENLSKGNLKILKLAKEEAVRLSQSYVGSEHLLLGIIKDSSGNAAKILKSIGLNMNEIKLAIEELVKLNSANSGAFTLGHLPLTRRADKILRSSIDEAKKMGESMVRQPHLLLALVAAVQ